MEDEQELNLWPALADLLLAVVLVLVLVLFGVAIALAGEGAKLSRVQHQDLLRQPYVLHTTPFSLLPFPEVHQWPGVIHVHDFFFSFQLKPPARVCLF